VYLLLLGFFSGIPVFWDMYGQVKTAHYFLESNFTNLFPDGNSFSDNGHLPLYPLYLAALFKLLGYNLMVAHFSVLPFLLGILWQLQKFCRRFLNEGHTFLVLLFTLLHPAFITQSIYFSSEISLVFFSLWLINALQSDRASHIAMAAVFLCLFNLRGISLTTVLFIYFFFRKQNLNAWYLGCGFLAGMTGLLIHYKISGWFFQGDEIKEFRSVASLTVMLKNAGLFFFKLIDLGSVFGWAAVIFIAIKARKIPETVWVLLIVCISVFLVCVPFTNPISNRYFLFCYVLLLPVFLHSIVVLPKKLFILVNFCFAIVLFSNNGVMYPDKYGNTWDCSLKSLPYFKLRAQLDEYVAEQKISTTDVAAGFQLYFNDKYYLMNNSDKEYSLLSDTEMPSTLYVAESNVCNNYNVARQSFLETNYQGIKTFKSGAVYIFLYKKR